MTNEEFRRLSPVRPPEETDSQQEEEAQDFLGLRLLYDPYSPTAEEDYERLKGDLRRFDILGMLARELRKTRVDEALVRHLIRCLRYLTPDVKESAVRSLFANLEVLYPVIPTVVLVVRGLLDDLSGELKTDLFEILRDQIRNGSYLFRVPGNMAFALRLIVHDPSEETDTLLARVYSGHDAPMSLKRDVILCMAKRRTEFWLADVLRRFSGLTPWEKRALLPASYVLGDEGSEWRKRIRKELNRIDGAFLGWVGQKNDGALWELPI